MLALSTKSFSVTINAVKQKIYFVTHPLLFSRAQATRVVSFEEIEQVYLNFWENSYTIKHQDEYTTHDEPRIWRRWAIELTLRDGQIVTIGEETTDHRADETSALARQRAYWEPLAVSVSKLIGKPLAAMPPVRDIPRTFVEAIDQIVQCRLKQSGLSNLSVNIRSTKDLGLKIVVNGKSYTGVDEVEDEVARNLIQASIDEWQGSSK
jgi:hypothetical protein